MQAFFGIAVLVCGWLLVAVSGLCTAGFANMAGPTNWRTLMTFGGIFNLAMFFLIFGCVPIVGTIVMVIATRRALKNKRSGR